MKWSSVINRAEQRGFFTANEMEKAREWQTCAVGEKLNLKGLSNDLAKSIVENRGYFKIGSVFYESVKKNNFDETRLILNKIMGLKK